jgi:penicillin-binding protein 1C
MSRTLTNYFEHPGENKYDRHDFHPLAYVKETSHSETVSELTETSSLSAAAIYQTFDALKEVYRPGEESGWKNFYSTKRVAWKTGTSFGFRDGWAVGVTPDYVVGVWVGNADGEGRPGLTGTETAAPVMFDIFSQLQGSRWFHRPDQELERITVCAKSGFRNTPLCDDVDTIFVTARGLESGTCPYHRRVHVDQQGRFQVHSACEDLATAAEVNWFVLPPVQEYYYGPRNLSYKTLPPFRKDCVTQVSVQSMDLIYPKPHARIFIPKGMNGEPGMVVFELAHRNPVLAVFWHLDGNFLASTIKDHRISLNPTSGKHQLTVIDENGEILQEEFEILSKM